MDLQSTIASKVSSVFNNSLFIGNRQTSEKNGPDKTNPNSEDLVTISPEGKNAAADSESNTNKVVENLTKQELAELQKMKQRDTEVRTHEQAHLSAAGQYARGGASFTYKKGPDGTSYAVGGEVNIDVSQESTPEATISKMRTIKRAALAPANPSATDKRIASQATAKEAQARQELLEVKQQDLLQGESGNSSLFVEQDATPNNNQNISTTASSYGTLKSVHAAYTSLAQKNSHSFSNTI